MQRLAPSGAIGGDLGPRVRATSSGRRALRMQRPYDMLGHPIGRSWGAPMSYDESMRQARRRLESTLMICPSQSSRRRVVVVDESRPSLLGSTHDKLPHGARGGEGCARDKEAAYSPIASPGEEWFSLHLQMWAPRRASVPRRTRAGCGLCNGTAVHYHLCPCVHRAAPASGAVCDAASARFYAPHLPAPLRRRMHSPLAFCIASCLLRIAHDVIASHQANLQRL